MEDLVSVFKTTNDLITDSVFIKKINSLKPFIKKVVSEGVLNELAIPNLSESIQFLNSFSVEESSAHIIQAQRDYFGAHTYQRKNDASEIYYHTEWKD